MGEANTGGSTAPSFPSTYAPPGSLDQLSVPTASLTRERRPVISGDYIRDLYFKAVKTIRAETLDYWMNHAFLMGQQWLWFNTETRRLDQIPRDPERVQATVNHMWAASRTVIGRLMARELKFEVLPSSPDDATVRGAKIGEAIIRDLWRRHDWETLRELADWAVWRGGTACISVEWDPTALDQIGQDPVTGKSFGNGDTVEHVQSIVEMAVEPGSWDAETARWWIKAKTFPPTQVQAMYQLEIPPPADATAGLTPFQNRLLNDARRGGGERADLTLVLTYYERPNWLRPEGLVCTVVNNQVVDGPYVWPFPFKDHLNFALIRETKVNARWTGETVLTMARPVQTAYNAAWSSIIEHLKLAGNARLMVPTSAVDLIDQLTDLPGEILPFNEQGNAPQYLSPPSMPQWWIETPQRLLEAMDDIMGTSAISRGDPPGSVESGVGLAILTENDTTPLSRLTKESAQAWGKIATMVLQCYSAFVRDAREAKVQEPGQPAFMEKWTGKDLAGQTTARVPLDAVTYRSRAAQQAFAERAMQMGLINTPEQFAKLAELPDARELIESVSPDVAKARRENHYFTLGEAPAPKEWDDHFMHIKEHNDFRKSVRYELLDLKNKRWLDMHIKGHESLSAEAMGGQLVKAQHSPVLAASANAEGAPTPMSPEEALQEAMRNQGGPADQGGPIPQGGIGAGPGNPQIGGGMGTPSPTGPAAAGAQPMSAPGGTPGNQPPGGSPVI